MLFRTKYTKNISSRNAAKVESRMLPPCSIFFSTNKKRRRLLAGHCLRQMSNDTAARSEETWMIYLNERFMNFSNFDNLPSFRTSGNKSNRSNSSKICTMPVDLFILKFNINQSLCDSSDMLEITWRTRNFK